MNEVRPGYKQTEVGVIPEDWEVEPIGKVAHIQTGPFGTLLKASEYSLHGGTPLISVREIGEGFIKTDYKTPYVSSEIIKRMPEYVLHSGDIVFGRKGAVDRSALVVREQEGWFLGSDGIRIRLSNRCDSEFVACQLQQQQIRRWLLQHATGTTMPSLNQEVLGRVNLALPTIAEQTAIAEVLSDTDALIQGLNQLIVKKRNIKQGAMQELITGNKRLPGFGGAWETKKLGDICERIIGGGTPSRSNPAYWGNGIPWATVKDFATFTPYNTQESVTIQGLKNSASNLIQSGTLITSTRMALGKAVIYKVDICINQDLKALFFKPDICVKYLFYWFEYQCKIIDELGSGSTVKGLSLSDLRSVEFIKPTLAEQTAIAAVLSDMDAEIEALEQKRDKYKAIKQGLMQELLTGKIRLV